MIISLILVPKISIAVSVWLYSRTASEATLLGNSYLQQRNDELKDFVPAEFN